MYRSFYWLSLLISFWLLACSQSTPTPPSESPTPPDSKTPQAPEVAEAVVKNIPLAGPIAQRDTEISGMAWYQDQLVLLPQYPAYLETRSMLFKIPKSQLQKSISTKKPSAIHPQEIPFDMAHVDKQIRGFEGFEAVEFIGSEAYFTIEAETDAGITGYLVKGMISGELDSIVIKPSTLTQIPSQSVYLENMAYESLLLHENQAIAIYEANGFNANPHAAAMYFDTELNFINSMNVPHIEYRITDVTRADDSGAFWAINYFYPGEQEILNPAPDTLVQQYGEGVTHQRFETVERLVELQYTPQGITRTETAPIFLQIINDKNGRNWEGLVRFDQQGFLIATDKFPQTLLGFIPSQGTP